MVVENAPDIKSGFIPVIKAYKELIAAAFLLMFFSGFGQSVFFGIYLPDIQDRFDINKTSLGSLYAAATLLSAGLMIYTGKFLDTMPLRHFIAFTLIGLALGCVVMGFATHPIMLFFAFLLLRQCGQGLMTLSGSTAVNRYIENGRGRAQSIIQTGLPLQAALFPVLGIMIIETLDYSNSWFFYAGLVAIILIPLFWILLSSHEAKTHKDWLARINSNETSDSDAKKQWTRLNVLSDWRFYAIMSVMVIPPCFGTAVFFYQSVIAENISITPAVFAGGFIFMTGASVSSALIAGMVLDKYGEKYLLIAFPILYAVGLCALSWAWNVPSLYAALAALGIGGGVMSITGGPLFAKMYGTKNYGSIKSLSVTSMIIASAVSPPLTGWLLDSNINITEILTYFAGYAVLSWLLVLAFINKITADERHSA